MSLVIHLCFAFLRERFGWDRPQPAWGQSWLRPEGLCSAAQVPKVKPNHTCNTEQSGNVVLAHAEMPVQSLLDGVVIGMKVCQHVQVAQVQARWAHSRDKKSWILVVLWSSPLAWFKK